MAFTDPGARRRQLATVAFVCGTALIAAYLWTRPTTIHGPIAAATLLDLARGQYGDSAVHADCDPRTPVTANGATVQCTLVFRDRKELHFEMHYGSDGRIRGTPIDARPASRSLGSP